MKRYRRYASMVAIAVWITLITCSLCSSWEGKVIGIRDGDTVSVLSEDKQQIIVRLYGIDCPEKRQDFGSAAKQFTSDMVFGKMISVKPLNTDTYGRTIAVVEIDGQNLSQLLVESGMAWVYEHYCKMDVCDTWRKAQEKARSKRSGLWSASNPVRPSEFRHSKESTPQTEVYQPNRSTYIPPSSYSNSNSPTSSSSPGGKVWVNSYQRKDGTTVRGHWRSK